MTAIVGVLNSQGIAVAADSAVTVSGSNGKKVYNRSNKIFTLSKFHPVGIAIFSSADFLGIPLETLIKIYRSRLGDQSFETLNEYKMDFIEFIKGYTTNVSYVIKERSLFNVVNENYNTLINKFNELLDNLQPHLAQLDPADPQALTAFLAPEITAVIADYQQRIDQIPKAEYIQKTYEEFTAFYDNSLSVVTNHILTKVEEQWPEMFLNDVHIDAIRHLLFSVINIEHIFERYCGLVFVGFGENEIFPSSQLIYIGSAICDVPRILIQEPVSIKPGELDSNILPYVQGDVTQTVLTGVDPSYKREVQKSVKTAFSTISDELANILNNPAQSDPLTNVINATGDQLLQDLDNYQFDTLTGPLLEILTHMGKEDMSELAESLVNITSLKRKFTAVNSSDESVGGPVDVAIITKGDGFIWMKRKEYFDINSNRGFYNKYYK